MPYIPTTHRKDMKITASFYSAALITAAAKNDVRSYLKSVRVEPSPDGGALIVATDGHRILVAHDAKAEGVETCLLPLVKVPTKCDVINVTLGEHVSFNFGATTVTAPKVEGNYPEWRRVLPTTHRKDAEIYNGNHLCADYLADSLKISKALGASNYKHIKVEHSGSMTSVYFAGHPCHYHIMGVRPDGLDFPNFTV